jgi:hypothetical protein
MKRIQFTVDARRLAQDQSASVPDDIAKKGDEAIKEWLINTGEIDNALDYAESETKITVYAD